MLDTVQFSVPLWPGLQPDEIEAQVIPTLSSCQEYVSDLYVTCRIPPFKMDAMGGIIVKEEESTALNNALIIGEATGLPISLTFNNTSVVPSFANYKIFVEHLAPIYERGVRIITIPNTIWLRFGLKKEFPELFVKNTILNRVNTASEVAVLFGEGFDYINLDRNLMRNETALKDIRRAKNVMEKALGRKLYLSLLMNEGCAGVCPIQQDHFAYNFGRSESNAPYFKCESGNVSPCTQTAASEKLWKLKAANIPAFYSHLDHLSKYVDVFKLHGRESQQVFYDSLNILSQFARRQLINDPVRDLFDDHPREKKQWLNAIKDCRFDCWGCNVCENIIKRIK